MKPKPITAETAADIVVACRHASGHETVYAAGKAASVDDGTIHRIESNKRDPSVGKLRALLKALGWRLKLVADEWED